SPATSCPDRWSWSIGWSDPRRGRPTTVGRSRSQPLTPPVEVLTCIGVGFWIAVSYAVFATILGPHFAFIVVLPDVRPARRPTRTANGSTVRVAEERKE